ncbi:MAG: hypothetical protein JNL88_12260 [Bacteroidia bacterium]|nr:hypothetical protein [Bacteroidia bacterium]
MKERIVFILSRGDRADFLNDFCTQVSSFWNCDFSLLLAGPRPVPGPAVQRFIRKQYAGVLPNTDSNTALRSFDENGGEVQVVVNLSHESVSHPLLQQVPEIRSTFFSERYDRFCPALAKALSMGETHCSYTVEAMAPGKENSSLKTGRFKVLSHSYRKSYDLHFALNLRLLLDALLLLKNGSRGTETEVKPAVVLHDKELADAEKKIRRAALKHRLELLFYRVRWNIGLVASTPEKIALDRDSRFPVKWFPEEDTNGFRADPFGLETDGKTMILFEQFIQGKGIISSMNSEQVVSSVLEKDVHLSYPFLFHHQDQWYCMPEQHQSGELILYKYEASENKLTEHCTLLHRFNAVDPTLCYYNNKWWLFCTQSDDKGADLRLYIFHSESLEGPFHPHAQNPVKTDICSARPAGPCFIHESVLYRPAQNSSIRYGGSVVIHSVDLLTEEEFQESPVNEIHPEQFTGPYTEGFHTLSPMGAFTLIDGKRKVFTLRNLFPLFRKKRDARIKLH